MYFVQKQLHRTLIHQQFSLCKYVCVFNSLKLPSALNDERASEKSVMLICEQRRVIDSQRNCNFLLTFAWFFVLQIKGCAYLHVSIY